MRKKPYYSFRTGKRDRSDAFSFDVIKQLIHSVFDDLEREGYFQEYFGYHCVDSGFVDGEFGPNVNARILLELGKEGIWPFAAHIVSYSEDDLFDVIEFVYEYVSEPVERKYHDYGDCGWHCHSFDREPGRVVFRRRVNEVLPKYSTGYLLSKDGEIQVKPDSGMETLEAAEVPSGDPKNITARVEAAKTKFRARVSTFDDRRDAIRDLVDVLEYLRPQIKDVLESKDESDLFNIANNFGIRHHKTDQKTNYDPAIWHSWMYYYYLATIHAVVRLIEKSKSAG